MFTYGHCYFAEDGTPFKSLQDAQSHQIFQILNGKALSPFDADNVTKLILEKRADFLAILSQKERQRVRASKPASRGVKRKNVSASNLGKQLPLPAKETAGTPPQSQKDAA